MRLKRIGLDTSKAVFILPGVGHDETAVLRRNMRRAEMEAVFAKLPPTHVALEACGGSHHWGRRLALTIDPGRFQFGRQVAAWLGLVPKERSTGGRQRLGGISRAGNERLRQFPKMQQGRTGGWRSGRSPL